MGKESFDNIIAILVAIPFLLAVFILGHLFYILPFVLVGMFIWEIIKVKIKNFLD